MTHTSQPRLLLPSPDEKQTNLPLRDLPVLVLVSCKPTKCMLYAAIWIASMSALVYLLPSWLRTVLLAPPVSFTSVAPSELEL